LVNELIEARQHNAVKRVLARAIAGSLAAT
jgi:hypothetical protein